MKKIYSNVNVEKLHGEFIKVSIEPFPVYDLGDNTGEFTFPDGTDMTAVQTVIDAHNPEPLPSPLTELEQFKIEQAQADAELFEMMLMLTGGGF